MDYQRSGALATASTGVFRANVLSAKGFHPICGGMAEARCVHHRTQVVGLATPDEDVVEAFEEMRVDPLVEEEDSRGTREQVVMCLLHNAAGYEEQTRTTRAHAMCDRGRIFRLKTFLERRRPFTKSRVNLVHLLQM